VKRGNSDRIGDAPAIRVVDGGAESDRAQTGKRVMAFNRRPTGTARGI